MEVPAEYVAAPEAAPVVEEVKPEAAPTPAVSVAPATPAPAAPKAEDDIFGEYDDVITFIRKSKK